MEELEQQIFEIITHSGSARAMLYEAFKEVQNGNVDKANELMDSSSKEMTLAHNVQTKLITADMNGGTKISLLLIHAQDQLMTTMSEQTIIEQMINMQKEINILKNK